MLQILDVNTFVREVLHALYILDVAVGLHSLNEIKQQSSNFRDALPPSGETVL